MRIPELQPIRDIELPKILSWKESEKVDVFYIPAPDYLYCRLDIFFVGGRHIEAKRFLSKVTALMLKEGRIPGGEEDISDVFDELGASVRVLVDFDYTGLSVRCLKKNLKPILEALRTLFSEFQVDEKDLLRLKKRAKSALLQDEFNAEIKSYRLFTECLFGRDHAYGYNSTDLDIDAVAGSDIVEHFRTMRDHYPIKIFCTADLTDVELQEVCTLRINDDKELKNIRYEPTHAIPPFFQEVEISKMGQATLKVGCKCFPQTPKDLLATYVSSIWLGGFFGSAFMKNIRETAGLTYGIHAHLEMFAYDGMFVISTDCNAENSLQIRQMMKDITCSFIDRGMKDRNLQMVKKYLKGYIISALNGTVNQLETIENMFLNSWPREVFENIDSMLEQLTVHDMQQACALYLAPEMWSYAVVNY